jgi:hypothetical protein
MHLIVSPDAADLREVPGSPVGSSSRRRVQGARRKAKINQKAYLYKYTI